MTQLKIIAPLNFRPAIEACRARLNLVEVIERYLPLKQRGVRYVACCPFHEEKTPSFTVDPQRGHWHCFGCGAHGDAFAFVQRMDNLSFVEAFRALGSTWSTWGTPVPYRRSLW